MQVAKASEVFLPHLRLWRADKGMTQEQLAAAAGVSRGTVLRAENGGSTTILSATRIAKALGISVKRLQTEEPAS